MTNEEVLDYLNSIPITDSGKYYMTFVKVEPVRIAISALEKQIPKKVSSGIDRTWGKETVEPVCPSCDYFLPRFQFIGNGKRVAYCEHCGQAIDWTEGE